MKSIKIQIIVSIVAAILVGLLMLGISYNISAHNVSHKEMPIPAPSITHQIFTAFLWIGIAILIALLITAVVTATNQIKKRQRFNCMEKYNFQQHKSAHHQTSATPTTMSCFK